MGAPFLSEARCVQTIADTTSQVRFSVKVVFPSFVSFIRMLSFNHGDRYSDLYFCLERVRRLFSTEAAAAGCAVMTGRHHGSFHSMVEELNATTGSSGA